jgi:hypothetical protein
MRAVLLVEANRVQSQHPDEVVFYLTDTFLRHKA